MELHCFLLGRATDFTCLFKYTWQNDSLNIWRIKMSIMERPAVVWLTCKPAEQNQATITFRAVCPTLQKKQKQQTSQTIPACWWYPIGIDLLCLSKAQEVREMNTLSNDRKCWPNTTFSFPQLWECGFLLKHANLLSLPPPHLPPLNKLILNKFIFTLTALWGGWTVARSQSRTQHPAPSGSKVAFLSVLVVLVSHDEILFFWISRFC